MAHKVLEEKEVFNATRRANSMSTTTPPDRNSTRGHGIPRWVLLLLGLSLWSVGMPLVHGILPWAFLVALRPDTAGRRATRGPGTGWG